MSETEFQVLRERLDRVLSEFIGERARQLNEIDPVLAAQGEAARALLLAGGKRLRPAFCYWAWRAAGGPDTSAIIAAAASLELLHGSAIVHDDVMDGADTRRGEPAAHRRFELLHRDSDWRGDSARFGISGAILLGDLLLSWSGQLFRESGLDAAALARGYPYLDLMRTEVMGGQYLDLVTQSSGSATTEQAERVLRYKSAKYSVQRPLHLGAALAGAPDPLLRSLSDYGLPLGEAFQMRDDVLGVFGDPTVTGKPAGDDLREGKRTVLVTNTLETADDTQRETFSRLLGEPTMDQDAVRTMREIIVASGALARVERRIDQLTERAATALASADLAKEPRLALEDLITAAIARTS